MHAKHQRTKQILQDYRVSLHAEVNNELPEKLTRCKQYLIEHLFDEKLCLSELKTACGVCNRNFTSRFSLYMGTTPKRYIVQLRVAAGKILIEQTDHSVAEISVLIGFSTQSAFSKAFKKATGKAPTDWMALKSA